MTQGPAALGVQTGIQIGLVFIQNLIRLEVVKPQQPVGLIEPVLAEKGRLEPLGGREEGAVGHGHVGGVKDPLEAVGAVEPLGEGQDLPVILSGGPYDHLGGLACRSKAGGVAIHLQLLLGDGDPVPNLPHRGQNGLLLLVRGQQGQTLGAGQLDVHAQPVGQQPQLLGKQGVGPGDGLGVDVAPKAVLLPQQAQTLDHPLGGVVRVPEDGGGEKEPLNVVAAVKAHGELTQFPGGEGGSGQVVGAAIDAVLAVVDTHIGHQHF